MNPLKVAIVYDRVNTPHGGAEQVLLALHQIFPKAPLYTSLFHPRAHWSQGFTVKSSWLQRVPSLALWHRAIPFLMPLAFESFDFSGYDVVISVTSAEAKGILTLPHQLHVCYLLTPTRYLHSHFHSYLDKIWWWLRPLARPFLRYLRWWDSAAAARPDVLIPISKLVADRTQRYYHRTTQPPIYPPVALPQKIFASWTVPAHWSSFWSQPFFLCVARLVAYKRIDSAIAAAIMSQKLLVIVGDGPQLRQLKHQARGHSNIQFLQHLTNLELAALYQKATATIMVGVEDFGITALESLSYGTPVILNHQSGAAELITDRVHGIYVHSIEPQVVAQAMQQAQAIKWSRAKLKKHVENYQTTAFQKRFQAAITELWYQKGQYD